ncbi:hypothetical protein Gogos_022073 [Gossypium gossypioides]|uniref:Uncharacterized protein n=1 Tax=Gossypium gossypioides TaxID=34282 RepID=A0A7J9D784_GOSGO|nr:hypothetical protein [Gossypium gossypioides]
MTTLSRFTNSILLTPDIWDVTSSVTVLKEEKWKEKRKQEEREKLCGGAWWLPQWRFNNKMMVIQGEEMVEEKEKESKKGGLMNHSYGKNGGISKKGEYRVKRGSWSPQLSLEVVRAIPESVLNNSNSTLIRRIQRIMPHEVRKTSRSCCIRILVNKLAYPGGVIVVGFLSKEIVIGFKRCARLRP